VLYNCIIKLDLKEVEWKDVHRIDWVQAGDKFSVLMMTTNYKGVKNNTDFGKITGMKETLDSTCK